MSLFTRFPASYPNQLVLLVAQTAKVLKLQVPFYFIFQVVCGMGFPCSSAGKESICNVGDPDLILGGEDSLEKG